MTDTETIEQVGKSLISGIEQLTKIAVCREQETAQLINKHYQDVVIANIDAKSKEISADKVIAWAQITPEYFQASSSQHQASQYLLGRGRTQIPLRPLAARLSRRLLQRLLRPAHRPNNRIPQIPPLKSSVNSGGFHPPLKKHPL